jgi:Flp pilus assembly pilin Flp
LVYHVGFLFSVARKVANIRKNSMKTRLVSWIAQFRRDEEGPTVVDYVLMLALIIVVCMAAITILVAK